MRWLGIGRMKRDETQDAPQKRRLLSAADVENSTITDRYLFWMLGQILAPYRWKLVWVFVLLIAVTALTLLLPYLIQQAVDGPITRRELDALVPYGIAYFITIVAIFGLRFYHTYLLQTVGQDALVRLRQQLFEHVLKQDMGFFNTTPVGQLVSRLSSDIEALSELLSTSIVMVASNMVTLVGIIGVMLALNWRLALLALAVMPIMVWATVFWRGKIRAASNRYHKVVADYLTFINEQFNGMLIVQLFGRQGVSRAELDKVAVRHRDVHMNLRDYYTAYASILQFFTSVGLALVLYGGGQGVLASWATLGMVLAFIEYTRRSFEPILQLSEQVAQIQTALSAGERIARMLRVEPDIVQSQQPKTLALETAKSVTFDHVWFQYEPDAPVLRDVNMHIPAGQRVAIVGATGAGKTSLAGLLARFYDVNKGSVQIAAIDVRDFTLSELRHHVTVVPQNPYCFNGTIADNLRLFTPEISSEAMRSAAEVACAAPFIERMPEGYETMLLPGGANLSQGQRQLLALARAILHSPHSILVLDEATSSIDTETESLIQLGLERVLANRTSIIIAHRLSTVRDADRILVMRRGQIVEDGDHDMLIKREGLYARLYRRQFVGVGIDWRGDKRGTDEFPDVQRQRAAGD